MRTQVGPILHPLLSGKAWNVRPIKEIDDITWLSVWYNFQDVEDYLWTIERTIKLQVDVSLIPDSFRSLKPVGAPTSSRLKSS